MFQMALLMWACILLLCCANLHVTNSTTYELKSAGLKEVPRDIPSNTIKVSLPDNLIQFINEDDFTHLQKMEVLRMQKNQLSNVSHQAFKNAHALRTVFFGSNNLGSVPYLGDVCDTLRYLGLNHNQIATIDCVDFSGCSHLSNLRLASNIITFIDRCAFQGMSVNHLELKDNRLTSIPYLGDLSNSLAELSLEYNLIVSISGADLQGLVNMETLHMQGNELVDIVQDAFQNTGLIELNLADNRLTTIPYLLGVASTFERLYFCNNSLVGGLRQEDFEGLGKLSVVDLSGSVRLACCDGEAEWLKNVTFDLILTTAPCAQPDSLLTKPWDDVTVAQLRQPCHEGNTRLSLPFPATMLQL